MTNGEPKEQNPTEPNTAAPSGDPASITAAEPVSPGVTARPLDALVPELDVGETVDADDESLPKRIKTLLIGKPRDLQDSSLFHHITLVAFLAWVGLGADGLSSSCYGPEEAFHNLHGHSYLAIFLSLATIITVFVISACYSHILEQFPSGGGGYLVASKLLGPRVGVVSGCALLVDYVLTITVSVAAAGEAIFGLLGPHQRYAKEPAEAAAIVLLIILNLRGIKESVKVLVPIFVTFLVVHAILIFGTLALHAADAGTVLEKVSDEVASGIADPNFGLWGMLALLLHAYSMGAGTYTGIEAVSNSMPVMREPRVATAKRTMIYMAASLAITAGGLMLAYLLLDIQRVEGKTMNQTLTESLVSSVGFGSSWAGKLFVLVTMAAEGALLIVAAQAGFIDGPRVLANMAHDSWMPHWFANLSERLATHNGILLMGVSALAALLWTSGDVTTLVIMYSINVFLTFSLSMVGMCRHWWQTRDNPSLRRRRLALFGLGATMCLAILCVTVNVKFSEGGWITLGVTGALIGLCFGINWHYRNLMIRLRKLDATLSAIPAHGKPVIVPPNPNEPTAAILVGGYGGLGVHTMLNAIRFAPGHFKNLLFLSVAVVDSGNFKGADAVDDLRKHCTDSLDKYVDLANSLGMPAEAFLSIGTDAVDELERLCLEVHKQFPKAIFFAGKLVFQKDTVFGRLLHNQTALSLQRRLQWRGLPMTILPTRVR
ncbi:MAG TPA: APC family permease [Pirellulales bacterium]|jgi:amino acid transporter|nr:APC family permease [Pirellulales bacterium]